MPTWRLLLVCFCLGIVLGGGMVWGTRKATDLYGEIGERLTRIESYLGQLDRLLKSR